MRYDLALICEFCREIGLSARIDADQRVEVDLGYGAILCFQNADCEEDCLIGFFGTPWHTHDELTVGTTSTSIEFDYLDLLVGLKQGVLLICEREVDGRIADRWLIHNEHNDEFKYIEEGERIIVRRSPIQRGETKP